MCAAELTIFLRVTQALLCIVMIGECSLRRRIPAVPPPTARSSDKIVVEGLVLARFEVLFQVLVVVEGVDALARDAQQESVWTERTQRSSFFPSLKSAACCSNM